MFDAEENPNVPPLLQPHDFDRLREAVGLEGPLAAADWLCEKLEANKDYAALFYASLMKKRIELGISPFPAGPASEISAEHHDAYEETIRQVGRRVGHLFLKAKDFPHAWSYFNMLGESQPMIDALDAYNPGPDEEIQPAVEVALHHQVNIPKGFDLVVERYGICNAITTYSGIDFSRQPLAKQHCIRRLIDTLNEQLKDRLRSDLQAHGENPPESATVAELIAGRDYLFEGGNYHVDTSHLASVIQFSLDLEIGDQLRTAAELALYGSKLSGGYQMEMDPPFEKGYADYRIYLEVLAGVQVEEGLKYFRDKIEPAWELEFTLPAEIYVNLLLRLKRLDEAREIAKKYLAQVQGRQMACPGVYELCLQANDYVGLAEAARLRNDGVSFVAALVSSNAHSE